jgi:hypothetical protein
VKTKICTKCGKRKAISQFYKHTTTKDKLRPDCKECSDKFGKIHRDKNKEHYHKLEQIRYSKNKKRIYQLKKELLKKHPIKHKIYQKEASLKYKFNITLADYNKLLKNQNNTCAICNKKETRKDYRTNITRSLSIDHNHKTGKIRGLLCSKCNNAIGLFNDNVTILNKAINYLKKGEQHD